MYTILRTSKLGTPTNLTTCGKKSLTFRPLDILASNHFIPFNKFNVVDGFDGSPVTTSCVLTVDGDILSSKNCASPIVDKADETKLEEYNPEVSIDEIACEAAVVASATADATSVVGEDADHGL